MTNGIFAAGVIGTILLTSFVLVWIATEFKWALGYLVVMLATIAYIFGVATIWAWIAEMFA